MHTLLFSLCTQYLVFCSKRSYHKLVKARHGCIPWTQILTNAGNVSIMSWCSLTSLEFPTKLYHDKSVSRSDQPPVRRIQRIRAYHCQPWDQAWQPSLENLVYNRNPHGRSRLLAWNQCRSGAASDYRQGRNHTSRQYYLILGYIAHRFSVARLFGVPRIRKAEGLWWRNQDGWEWVWNG